VAGERYVHTPATLGKAANYEITEFIIHDIAQNAQKASKDFKQANLYPDPSFTLQLSDETLSASNLLAFQKFFDGEFEFDIFYESRSAEKALSGISIKSSALLAGANAPQLLPLMKALPRFPPHSTSALTRYFPFPIPQNGKCWKHSRRQSPQTCLVGLDIFTAHRS
jgi:hypothetical protein